MTEETTITEKDPVQTESVTVQKQTVGPTTQDSNIFNVSVRAWLAIILVGTVCGSHISIVIATMVDAVSRGDFSKVGTYTTIGEPLYSLAGLALGFYFGQKVTKP